VSGGVHQMAPGGVHLWINRLGAVKSAATRKKNDRPLRITKSSRGGDL